MYMASAMADLALELDDVGLKRACEALWRDVTTAQMYVTAGLGPEKTNEGFTEPYDLPNETAYAETCASVALIFWAHRMLHLDLDGALRRRDGACAFQWGAERARDATGGIISIRIRSRAAASTGAGPGTSALAAR